MQNKISKFCCFAVILGATCGCVSEETDGATHVFTYETWVPLSVLLGGLAAAPAGWFLRKSSARFGWALLLLGPVAAIFFAPSLFRDRAEVDETSLFIRTGIWGLTAVHEVPFDTLEQVRIVSEETRGRRGRKRTNYFMLCEQNNGNTAKVPINNAVSEAAAPEFLKRVSELGIPVTDET